MSNLSAVEQVEKVTDKDQLAESFLHILAIMTIVGSALLFTYDMYAESKQTIEIFSGIEFTFVMTVATFILGITTLIAQHYLATHYAPASVTILLSFVTIMIVFSTDEYPELQWLIGFLGVITIIVGAVQNSRRWWWITMGIIIASWLAAGWLVRDDFPWLPTASILFTGAIASYYIHQGRLRQWRSITTFTNETLDAAFTDTLTGLYNRRGLREHVVLEAEKLSDRTGDPITVTFIDINKLKKANDTWGHQIGDEGIKTVANALRAVVRSQDWIARWGGDEFVILSVGKAIDAQEVERRINTWVHLNAQGNIWQPTVSVGQAKGNREQPLETTLLTADEEMYRHKNGV